jgi:ketosteroid isomerase-like protein
MTGDDAETNLERLRRLYRGEDIAVLEMTDDAEFVNPPEAIEPGIRRGAAEVTRALRKPHESFDTTRYEVHDFFDAGDTVVASVNFSATVGGSDSEIVQEEVHTWTFREGKVARFEWGRDLDAALAAAGISR